jgi:hypothetical protein
VTNPQPGGGSSAPQQVDVIPQLVSVTPTSAPVGGSVNLQLTGVDSSNASSVVVSFAQTGRTFTATNGTFSSSGGAPELTIAVPSGLAPASASAPIGAPAQIAASVNSIAATATLPFTVQPPTHAGEISPATVQIGLSVPMTFAGVATAFDGSTTITSDDPGITFTGSAANSSTIFLSNMTVAAGTKLGTHTITVTEQGNALQYALQVLAAAAAPVISSASPTSGAPASPITITGTGFGADTSTSVVLDFSYAGAEVQTPATATSATEIDSFMPVFIDPNSGSVYAGPVSLAVIINGQPSNTLSITLSPLPTNTSAVGTTTLAAIDQAISNATSAQTQLATPTLLSSDQADSANALFTATVASLKTFRANVVTAASGQTVTNPDGTTFDASSVDVLDRLLQSGGSQTGVTPALRGLASNDGLRPLAQNAQDSSSATDQQLVQAGKACSAVDGFKQFKTYFGLASDAVCLASVVFPPAAPVCALMKEFSTAAAVVIDVEGAICDAAPVTLSAVSPNPTSISTFPDGPPIIEIPSGRFQSSPKEVGNGLASLLEETLGQLNKIKGIVNFFPKIGVSKELGKTLIDTVTDDFGQLIDKFFDDHIPSFGVLASTSIPLTLATTSLIADRNNLVQTSGLTVTPGSQTGETFLTFNTSAFRMFDATGNVTTEPTLVPGNMLQVTIGNATVVLSPSTAALAPGATQQFTATVQGPTNTAVSWSVNGVAGGNATVGTISDQGLYTAPTTIPSPATVSITATSQAVTSLSGSASVTISNASVTVTPSSVVLLAAATQQFTAVVQGLSDTSVSWSVNGVAGGNASVGTITSQGLYTAPPVVPSPATVSISAASEAAPSASGSAKVIIAKSVVSQFDAPGAGTGIGQGTYPVTIDAAGNVLGIYSDSTFTAHGFMRAADGTISTFDAPGAGSGKAGSFQFKIKWGTFPVAINATGVITGESIDSNYVTHGFVRSANGTIITFDAPGAGDKSSDGTYPVGIDDAGNIVGIFNAKNHASGFSRGFVRAPNGTFTTFAVPGALSANGGASVNSAGDFTGAYAAPSSGSSTSNYSYHGFLRTANGAIVTFDVPGATTVAGQGTYPLGIDNEGDVAGWYTDTNLTTHGFVRSASGSIVTFDAPGSLASTPYTLAATLYRGTIPVAVDTAGNITGIFADAAGIVHGFERTASGTMTTFDAPGAGTVPSKKSLPRGLPKFGGRLIAATGTSPVSIAGGNVAGTLLDAQKVFHGFVVETDGSVTTFSSPSAGTGAYRGTAGFTVNTAGTVAGTYADANLVLHGFVFKPDQVSTTTALASSLSSPVYGQPVSFTATISSDNGTPPDGETVYFMNGSGLLGTGTLSNGTASLKTTALPIGTDQIKASYGGDWNFSGSNSSIVTETVSKAASSTALAASPNPVKSSQPVTLTVSVTGQFSGTPTGTVTFNYGSTVVGTVSLSNGSASLTTALLPVGTDSVTAVYSGDANFVGSTSAAVSIVVQQSQ